MNKSEYTKHAAKFAGELTFDRIPSEVVSILKKSFMDTIGVMLAGSKSDEGRTIIKYVKASNEPGPISVLGSGLCATIDTAALANGTFSHALDFDDCCDSVKGTQVSRLCRQYLRCASLLRFQERKPSRPMPPDLRWKLIWELRLVTHAMKKGSILQERLELLERQLQLANSSD